MTTPTMGTLDLTLASDSLLAPVVAAAIRQWSAFAVPGRGSGGLAGGGYSREIYTAAIDPALSDTAAFCDHYGVPQSASANCVVVTGKRDGEQRWAAAVVLATTRADVNGVVRRRMDVRKVSFAAMAEAVETTGMEYGGITPIGLPAGWPILIDLAVTQAGLVVIGSGLRASKIIVDGAALATLPAAEVIEGLAS